MPRLSFCQNGYPKLIVHDGDTLVAITRHQLDIINVTKVDYDRTKELNKNLQKRLDDQQTIIISKKATIDLLKSTTIDTDKIIVNNELDMLELRRKLREMEDNNVKLTKQRNTAWIVTGTIVAIEVIHYTLAILFSR